MLRAIKIDTKVFMHEVIVISHMYLSFSLKACGSIETNQLKIEGIQSAMPTIKNPHLISGTFINLQSIFPIR